MGGMLNSSGNMGGMLGGDGMGMMYSNQMMGQSMMSPQQQTQHSAQATPSDCPVHGPAWTSPPNDDQSVAPWTRTASSTTASGTPPTPEAGGTTLLVSKLPESADCKVLRSFLVGSGFEVECATVIRHKDGGSRCFGFVRFANPTEAAQAKAAVDRPEFKMRDARTGEMWKVEATWAKSDTRKAVARRG
mmetsp:Transcript_26269/g.58052  ORF Transcript_26269/g.58052 Transcript_26269/m.58052 type:complete len:189 (+) Transcript_26269:1-567(+)